MKKYDVVLRAEYEKKLFVYADNEDEAREKIEMFLFDTNAVTFENENFVSGEAEITEKYSENGSCFYDEVCANEVPFSEGKGGCHKSKKSRRS